MTFDAYRTPAITASDIFECCQCGECCRGYGGTFLTESDIHVIAGYIGTSPDDFVGEYCSQSGSGLVVVQGEDGYCIFAEQGRCRIHPVKPRMCKSWPFIESVLRDPNNWYVMAGACPGMRADVPESVVCRCVKDALEESGEKGRKE